MGCSSDSLYTTVGVCTVIYTKRTSCKELHSPHTHCFLLTSTPPSPPPKRWSPGCALFNKKSIYQSNSVACCLLATMVTTSEKRHEVLDDLLAHHAYRTTKHHVYKYALRVQRVNVHVLVFVCAHVSCTMYACTHIGTCMCMHECVLCMCTCTYRHFVSVCMCTFTRVCVHVYLRTHVCACVRVYMYVCVCVYHPACLSQWRLRNICIYLYLRNDW